jgi:hypothetical protein
MFTDLVVIFLLVLVCLLVTSAFIGLEKATTLPGGAIGAVFYYGYSLGIKGSDLTIWFISSTIFAIVCHIIISWLLMMYYGKNSSQQ